MYSKGLRYQKRLDKDLMEALKKEYQHKYPDA